MASRRPRDHRLVPQVALHVRSEGARALVAARTILFQRLQRNPVEIAADHAGLARPQRRPLGLHFADDPADFVEAGLLRIRGDDRFSLDLEYSRAARLLEHLKRYEESEALMRRSLTLDPRQSDVAQHFVHIRQKQCAWPVYDTDRLPK